MHSGCSDGNLALDLDKLLITLRKNIAELQRRGVQRLMIFGPAARGEGKPGSTVDFLLALEPPHTFDQFLEIKLFLEALLERPVELVVASPEHPNIHPYVEPDAIRIV